AVQQQRAHVKPAPARCNAHPNALGTLGRNGQTACRSSGIRMNAASSSRPRSGLAREAQRASTPRTRPSAVEYTTTKAVQPNAQRQTPRSPTLAHAAIASRSDGTPTQVAMSTEAASARETSSALAE